MFNMNVVSMIMVFIIAGVVSGKSGCSVDQSFKLTSGQDEFPVECQIGQPFNQIYLNYSIGGQGASAYILTDSQYQSYLEQVKNDVKYVPKKGEYYLWFYNTDFGFTSTSGHLVSKIPSNDFRTLRMLVKQNPNFDRLTASIHVKANIIPQHDDSETTVIVVATVGVCFGVLYCVSGAVVLICCYVKRRKASYHEIHY